MILKIEIPGKTFLLGEYLAMKTGESVVLTNSPLFEIDAKIKLDEIQGEVQLNEKYQFEYFKKLSEILAIEFEKEISFFKTNRNNGQNIANTQLENQHFRMANGNASIAHELDESLIQQHFKIFHPESPAGKFIFRHRDLFRFIEISWNDPYKNSGGLGASTAQYIGVVTVFNYLVYKFAKTKKNQPMNFSELGDLEFEFELNTQSDSHCDNDFLLGANSDSAYGNDAVAVKHDELRTNLIIDYGNDDRLALNSQKSFGQQMLFTCNDQMRVLLLKNYQSDAWNGQGQIPSGQDFLAQFMGGQSWVWPEISLILVRTGVKLATHHHLQNLNDFVFLNLKQIYELAVAAIEKRDSQMLIHAVNSYSEELDHLGFVADHTKTLILQLKTLSQVQAIKGCGAMGADLCLIICYQEDEEKLMNELKEKSYQIALKTSDLCDCGVKIYEN